jgi:hypothetical protein
MKFTKNKIDEIIDSNGELIGADALPKNGSDLESQANGTTDMNVNKSAQPFRYDMLGRFGFTLLPFFEGKENQGQSEMLTDLINLMYDRYKEILEFYYRNPNKLKSDFRKLSTGESDPKKEVNVEYAKKIIKIVEKHFENAFKPDTLDESNVVEDKVVNDKNEDEISNKNDDGDVKEKKIEKIAGLINKLDKKDVDKLMNLLERKEI